MSIADSATCFNDTVNELGLQTIKPKLEAEGWTTFNDFAFSSSDSSGKTRKCLRRRSLGKLLDVNDPNDKKLISKVRRLYAQSYIVMSAQMESLASPEGPDEKVHMAGRTEV